MNVVAEPLRPLARQEELVVETLPDEVLVYDLKRDKAHCLSRTAAVVWQYCDGHKSVPELAQAAQQELQTPVGEDVVWFALDQLGRSHLLQERVAPPGGSPISRRDLLRRAGVVAAAAVVTTIVAPTVAQAATCLPKDASCTASAQCCSGLCNNGGTCAA